VTGNILWSDKPQDNEPKSIHSASLNKLVENLTSEANPSTLGPYLTSRSLTRELLAQMKSP
jgi:hypothetical protein